MDVERDEGHTRRMTGVKVGAVVLVVAGLIGAPVVAHAETAKHHAHCYRTRTETAGVYSQWGPIVRAGRHDGYPHCRNITIKQG